MSDSIATGVEKQNALNGAVGEKGAEEHSRLVNLGKNAQDTKSGMVDKINAAGSINPIKTVF